MASITDVRSATTSQVSPRRRTKRSVFTGVLLLVALLAISIPLSMRVSGFSTGSMSEWFQEKPVLIASLAVDEGKVAAYLTESGELDSANNTTVKCEVEALLGTVGGIDGMGAASFGAQGISANRDTGRQMGTAAGGAVGGAANGNGNGADGDADANGNGGASSTSRDGGMGGAGGGGGGGISGSSRPQIRSFSYRVPPYAPLRAQPMGDSQRTSTVAMLDDTFAGQQRRGGGGGGGERSEAVGSTRIISLLPEGTEVKPGDIVCELDKSAFEDELQYQLIRHAQAKSWVEQAKTNLEIAEMELREYRDGVFIQDRGLVRRYIANTRTQEEQARMTLEWSEEMYQKGLRAESQLLSDRLMHERAEIELLEAQEMQRRLVEWTGPRILKSLEAKIEAVRSDLLGQQEAFNLEDDRLKRIFRAIELCTLAAPSEGIVVYARNTSGWGRVEDEIDEGAVVREGQDIFHLPDPNLMCVRVTINESKISSIRPGQKAKIRIDAFPNQVLTGTVTEVKPIPQPMNMVSDVNVYTATVNLDDGGFADLRPGLSAEVALQIGTRDKVTRVPVQALRWIDGDSYVAVTSPMGGHEWRLVHLGLMNASHAEVLSGLTPGERVATRPHDLPAPADLARMAQFDGIPSK